jgi:hypothetical protein
LFLADAKAAARIFNGYAAEDDNRDGLPGILLAFSGACGYILNVPRGTKRGLLSERVRKDGVGVKEAYHKAQTG